MRAQTILYIEDDWVTLTTYSQILREAGFKVETARDGIAALISLHKQEPDLILLDLVLPKLDGEEVLKFIYRSPQLSSIPVIVLSTNTVISLVNEPLVERADGHLLKENCTAQSLLATINRVLQEQDMTGLSSHDDSIVDPAALGNPEMLSHVRLDLKKPAPTPPGQNDVEPPTSLA